MGEESTDNGRSIRVPGTKRRSRGDNSINQPAHSAGAASLSRKCTIIYDVTRYVVAGREFHDTLTNLLPWCEYLNDLLCTDCCALPCFVDFCESNYSGFAFVRSSAFAWLAALTNGSWFFVSSGLVLTIN